MNTNNTKSKIKHVGSAKLKDCMHLADDAPILCKLGSVTVTTEFSDKQVNATVELGVGRAPRRVDSAEFERQAVKIELTKADFKRIRAALDEAEAAMAPFTNKR